MKITIVVTSPLIINAFLYDQIICLSKSHSVTVVTNLDEPPKLNLPNDKFKLKNIKIIRKVSVINDIEALCKLYAFFKTSNFDIVYSVTPKAGLLAMFAGFLARINCRIHVFTGQVWATRTGVGRLVLKYIDMLIAKLATHLLADSISQKIFLENENVADTNKLKVLASGSISGVDLNRFRKNTNIRFKIRDEFGIDKDEFVFLFLGRLNPDKGITDLIDAFRLISDQYSFVKLIIVGPDESGMHNQIISRLDNKTENIRLIDYTDNPEYYMNAADVLCIPSHREGFGTVVIEAAAVGIPAIGSNIYGLNDAIENNVTGLLFPVRDIQALYANMRKLVLDSELRLSLGKEAKLRAKKLFSQDYVTSAYVEYIQSCCVK